ncbi:hypothetical protein PENTCL1PPCAC_28928 [Pristionchus entomophagus]|uniref:RING-type E3 ubiquitin transferase n=1 Tax=Pristionchus entomophagus TaxID=358040 RepID=A0AAV5UIE8_9BILA|nr:hypothetical protein PENTCL1PPCAC_28928 [Pristionchus entomophagus]
MGQVGSRINPFRREQSGRSRGGASAEDGDDKTLDIYSRCESEGSSYFGTHFLLGEGRYEMAKPEASLFFVENKELDLLGDKPVMFPTNGLRGNERGSDLVIPVDVWVNVRKESVKFVRIAKEEGEEGPDKYRIEFMYDADKPGTIRLHFNALEINDGTDVRFGYRENKTDSFSAEYSFEIGADQIFNSYVFDTASFDMAKMQYKGGNYFPIVIACTVKEDERVQVQTTVCTITEASDSSKALMLKTRRQKVFVNGIMYLVQELFGIENKELRYAEDQPFECVICMNDIRDTVILPCRHLCLCYSCAEHLRQKQNNCPICRKPFRALSQLVAKKTVESGHGSRPNRYEQFMLVEALNGTLPQTPGNSSSLDEIRSVDEDIVRASMNKGRGQKVIGKKTVVEEMKETPEGIELTSVESFMHHPVVPVIVVKPAKVKEMPVRSVPRDHDSSSDEDNHEIAPVLPEISPEPSSTESKDSTDALLKKPEEVV